MPAQKKSNKPVKKAEWKGYHKVNLTDDQDAAFDAWFKENVPNFGWFDVYANQGYKLSFNFDDYHTGISASMYCTQAKMDWAGFTLTAWGETADEAFALLIYKHVVICEEHWEVAEERSEKSYKKRG